MTDRKIVKDGPTLAEAQAAGFPLGGEPLAVDLADTVIASGEETNDLLADQAACDRFWRLQSGRLPAGWEPPTLEATRRLRNAVRSLLDAAHDGSAVDRGAIGIVNAASAAAPVSLELDVVDGTFLTRERWHHHDGPGLALAAAAHSAISVLGETSVRSKLRRCANPTCSMLFVTGDNRRQWCTPNICGNRARVARHYQRHRTAP